MRANPKPKFTYIYKVETELEALRKHKVDRKIPEKDQRSLLLATWNLANFGVQERRPDDIHLMSEIIGWFDIIALQEMGSNLDHLQELMGFLGSKYRVLYTDLAGNVERMTFVFDVDKLSTRELVGEIAPPPSHFKRITIPGAKVQFQGFDRNPFLQSFTFKDFKFCLVNAHLYFKGKSEQKIAIQRRQLEALAMAQWAKSMVASKYATEKDILLLGDFNLPYMEEEDPIYKIFSKNGFHSTVHATSIGSTLPGQDRNVAKQVNHYDQIMFFPTTQHHVTEETGVFDYDQMIFADLYQNTGGKKKHADFFTYCRYYISDHRPLWVKIVPSEG